MTRCRLLCVAGAIVGALLGLAQAAPSPTNPLSSRQTNIAGLERCRPETFTAVLSKYGGSLATGSPYTSNSEPYPDVEKVLWYAQFPPLNIPDICGVRIMVTGNVAFEVYLPSPTKWNRRFLTVGNGGFAGRTSRYDMFGRAVHGWAVMSTNTGHEDASGGMSWAAGNQSLQIDWAWRAMASSVPFAKEIVAAYYQNVTPVANYYSGCSTGGRQGIRQIEVDPNSFDGVLLGAPAWNVRSAMPVISRIGWLAKTYGLNFDSREPIYSRVNQTCNLLGFDNTAADGVVRDSAACLRTFKESGINGSVWAGVDCPNNQPAPGCVTLSQRAAFMAILEEFKVPPQNQTYAGDGFDITSVKDWFNFLAGSAPDDFDQQFSRYFLNETIIWDSDANGARLIQRSNAWDAQVRVNANPAVLNGWRGKAIMYTGTADGTVSSIGTRRAFNMAGGTNNRNLAYFEIPGMPHCVDIGTGGYNPPWYIGQIGIGLILPSKVWYMPNTTNPPLNNAAHDALIALTEWVEGGSGRSAPTRLLATAFTGWNETVGTISKERPICAVPMRQHYVGGDVNAAGSWTCVAE